MNENKMNKNNDESDQIDNREQKSQESIDLDDDVIQLKVSTFKNILEGAISNLFFKNKSDVIDQKELVNKVKNSGHVQMNNQLEVFNGYIQSLANDLKQVKSVQPNMCLTDSVSVNINLGLTNKLNIATPHKNFNKEPDTIIISSDDEDIPIITADTTMKIKATSKKNKSIDLIDLVINNDSKEFNVKYRLDPKLETRFANNMISSNTKNKKVDKKNYLNYLEVPKNKKSRTNRQSSSKTTRKLEPKSMTMFDNNIIPSNTKNKKGGEKNCLNYFEILKNKTSTKFSNCHSLSITIRKSEPKTRTTFNNNIIPSSSKNNKSNEKNYLNHFEVSKHKKSKTMLNDKIIPSNSKRNIVSKKNWLNYYKIPKNEKSRTMLNDKIIPSNSKRNIVSKKNWLNYYKIPKNENSRTKNLSNYQSLSKSKPNAKSETMFANKMIPSNAKNNCLNDIKIPKNEKSRTTNVSNCQSLSETIKKPDPKSKTISNFWISNSVKKLEVAKNNHHNFHVRVSKYPPPFPPKYSLNVQPSWEKVPPIPKMTIKTSGNTVILTWDLKLSLYTAKIKMYELFVCKEIDADSDVSMWKMKGAIKPLMLPMACELEMYDLGYTYHFAMRAVDVHNRCTRFALQKTKI